MRGIQHDDDFVEKVSSHNRTLILFQALIGFIGLHRYMVRKIGTGIVFTCTLGFLGIGYLIDLIAVATGCFKDSEGLPVKSWVKKSE
ncbi:MAG: TM2 domain-containing protein [Asgard group archaeon]|nr:TM2 domain-containing protein [Asgard group archaeon]